MTERGRGERIERGEKCMGRECDEREERAREGRDIGDIERDEREEREERVGCIEMGDIERMWG